MTVKSYTHVVFRPTNLDSIKRGFIVKKLAAAIATALFAATAQAAPITQDFDVKVTLDAVCRIQGGAPATNPELNFGTYTAFDSASTPAPTLDIAIECTRGLAKPSLKIGVTDVDSTTPFYGVVAGLNYSVTADSAKTTTGTAASAVAGGVGSADVHTVTLTGAMDSGQAGACANNTATACATQQTDTHTLTITY